MECEKIKIKDLMLPLLHVVTESILLPFDSEKHCFLFAFVEVTVDGFSRGFFYEFLHENQSRMFRCLLSICSYQKRKIKKA